ncbi:hypothetical protein MFIFM68171_07530 [Madurella fahalii]|uniref:Potassium transport protein n=1 Tax=Madurella fahalii TaxID=1157608 RepID=A0ABQ0GI04_9PEZI
MRHRYGRLAHKCSRVMVTLRSWLPPLNFITVHYAYFIVVCLVTSLVFWGSSDPAWSIGYTDSLFLVVSAMTEAGLNTVNLSQMTTCQQTILFLLIVFGSSIWVSIWTVVARKHAFEKRFQDIVRAERMRRASRGSILTLPRLQQLLSFRKASVIPSPEPPTAIQQGELFDQENILPPLRTSPDPASASDPAPGTGSTMATDRGPRERPVSPVRIVFVDEPHPNAAASTAVQYHPQENPPICRSRSTGHEPADTEKNGFSMRHFLAKRSAGRNARFYDLTSEEREHLGGCEYRALKILSVLVPIYFILWQLLGCLALGAWIHNNQPATPLENGINPWWLGIFNGVSAFNNSGMTLLDANMIPFQNTHFVIITMGLLILAGNTAYPIFLRLIIWSFLNLVVVATQEDESCELKDTLRFILQYPRRVYTNLFPARLNWWLLFMLFLLNGIDWVAFELLNLGNPAIESIPRDSRVLDGLFQALAVRSGGFYIVPMTSVYIGLQVLYVIMMYISVYPVVITMRHSNVYEERSLGIYAEDELANTDDPEAGRGGPASAHSRRLDHHSISGNSLTTTLSRALRGTLTWHGVGARRPPKERGIATPESPISFISQQIHGQLAHDIWWLVLAILVIVTICTSHFLADPVSFSVFNVIFEVVSAYGCVGISVGTPRGAYSFCGSWPVAAKLVLCAVMIRGRHRGLPVALDRAVRLPGEELHEEEEEDHRIQRSLTNRRVSAEG